jgi:hypothetical protein
LIEMSRLLKLIVVQRLNEFLIVRCIWSAPPRGSNPVAARFQFGNCIFYVSHIINMRTPYASEKRMGLLPVLTCVPPTP